jgi:hypothetical protein
MEKIFSFAGGFIKGFLLFHLGILILVVYISKCQDPQVMEDLKARRAVMHQQEHSPKHESSNDSSPNTKTRASKPTKKKENRRAPP